MDEKEKLSALLSLVDDSTGGCFNPTKKNISVKFPVVILPTECYSILLVDDYGNVKIIQNYEVDSFIKRDKP